MSSDHFPSGVGKEVAHPIFLPKSYYKINKKLKIKNKKSLAGLISILVLYIKGLVSDRIPERKGYGG
jgi:hypothetical protein